MNFQFESGGERWLRGGAPIGKLGIQHRVDTKKKKDGRTLGAAIIVQSQSITRAGDDPTKKKKLGVRRKVGSGGAGPHNLFRTRKRIEIDGRRSGGTKTEENYCPEVGSQGVDFRMIFGERRGLRCF